MQYFLFKPHTLGRCTRLGQPLGQLIVFEI